MLSLLWTISALADDNALQSALARRDPVPSCHELSVLAREPVADFVRMAETIALPPWAPMRAAECVVMLHASDASETLERWVIDEQRAGLAKLVLRRLEHIPVEQAAPLAHAAMAGPLAGIALPFVAGDARSAVLEAAKGHTE